MKTRFVAIVSFLAVVAIAASPRQAAYGQITSPVNNSFLIAGSNQEITWGIKFDSTSIVVLQYSTDGGRNWNHIATICIAARSYDWVIPVTTNSYLCKVRMVKFTSHGYIPLSSTGIFSIASLDLATEISSVFTHRVIAVTDTSKRHFNRVQFFK